MFGRTYECRKDNGLFPAAKEQGWPWMENGGLSPYCRKDGTIVKPYDFEKVTNGVKGFNAETIHICYVGGVEEDNVKKAKDTRNFKQRASIQECIKEAIDWLEANGKNISKDLGVVGHRDFSNDKNDNGVIESWERIKECPSFDAMRDYSYLFASKDRYNKIPV